VREPHRKHHGHGRISSCDVASFSRAHKEEVHYARTLNEEDYSQAVTTACRSHLLLVVAGCVETRRIRDFPCCDMAPSWCRPFMTGDVDARQHRCHSLRPAGFRRCSRPEYAQVKATDGEKDSDGPFLSFGQSSLSTSIDGLQRFVALAVTRHLRIALRGAS
jgi:hypothetical protein